MTESSTHESFTDKEDIKAGSSRSFGFVCAAVFLIIALWPLIGGNPARLWPNLKKAHLGSYSNSLCKWFSRYKHKTEFEDKRYCYHSLHHNFIDAMKQNEVPEPVIRQLVGHREASITLGRYGKAYDLVKLNEYMQSVSFSLTL